METSYERLKSEKKSLDARLHYMNRFINGEDYKALSICERLLVLGQMVSMRAYSFFINKRVKKEK